MRSSLSLVSFCLLAVCATATGVVAQSLPGAAPSVSFLQPGRAPMPDPEAFFATQLELKLAEGSGAEWRNGALISRTGTDLQSVTRWLGDVEVAPLVTSVSRDVLEQWHQRACAVLPEGKRPGNLGLWFRVTADSEESARDLLANLAAEPLVAHVYREPRLYPASAAGLPTPACPSGDIPPTTPSFVAQQLSYSPTPLGHGVHLGAGVLGARGQGVNFRMIEDGWIFGHEDVCKIVPGAVIGPVPSATTTFAQHGCSGGSIIFGDRNEYGVTGIADEVTPTFFAALLNGGIANSMSLVLTNGQPNDVVMVVLIVLVPSLGPGTWLPFEFYQSAFDATLTATALGFHVVVPAGNGNRSLDDPALLGRFDRNFRDSGAIMVAASDGGNMVKASFSNWGSRIDAHSWGENVISCGYGTMFFPNNDILQSYTASGTGTSSSTPHIAGLVASIQGAAKLQTGQFLSNAEILAELHTIGAPTPDVIGLRPDLPGILAHIGAIDGLTMVAPDVSLGGTISAVMDGPPGSVSAMFGSFATGNIPLGFNRNVHLDLASMSALGAFVLATGTAQYDLPVPNNVALHGADIYFQAVRLTGTQPLHVTNSCQATIL